MSDQPLPRDHVDAVCKFGQGAETCAFLTLGPGVFRCAKRTDIEPHIRARLAAGTMNAKGDNCDGL